MAEDQTPPTRAAILRGVLIVVLLALSYLIAVHFGWLPAPSRHLDICGSYC